MYQNVENIHHVNVYFTFVRNIRVWNELLTAGGKEWSNSLLSFFRRENVYALMEFHHACALFR